MTDKTILPSKLLWIDLEMTGLNPQKDLILEVAAVITDFEFKILASYETRINQDKEKVEELLNANSWYAEQVPENKDIFLKVADNTKNSDQVENDLVELINNNFEGELAILAGNSIHCDRSFIQYYWPQLDKLLHYRMLDVSSWKLVMNSKFSVEFPKNSNHRAFDDIQASISELKYYLEWFNNNNQSPKIDTK
ncbi:MAG TPA: oligoribonuclease [Candidatus Saccharimonadales bacterium]|jgi:oligoribonuclease|nr:oligoribonuclease [Candidatus Saccharimonadales bacterium]